LLRKWDFSVLPTCAWLTYRCMEKSLGDEYEIKNKETVTLFWEGAV
jgi:hypothetical protein